MKKEQFNLLINTLLITHSKDFNQCDFAMKIIIAYSIYYCMLFNKNFVINAKPKSKICLLYK